MRGRRCFSAEQQLPNHSLRLPYDFLEGVKFISRNFLRVVGRALARFLKKLALLTMRSIVLIGT